MGKMLSLKKNIRNSKTGSQDGLSTGLPLDCQFSRYEMDLIEMDWKKSLPKFDTRYLIETFPEAKDLIIDKLQREINKAQEDIEEAKRLEPIYEDIIYRKSPKKDEDFWRDVCRILWLDPLRVEQVKTIKKNTMFLSMLKGESKTKNPIGVTPMEIARAKDHPITNLVEFKRGVACCFAHNEKTPSLHYYPKNNTCHCFGACGKSFDAIDVYRHLYKCSFVEAVRNLK